jgi:SAM-dependent methyltransferase
MGFDVQCVKFLLNARHQGVRFTRTAILGRQELFIEPAWLRRILRAFGLDGSEAAARRILAEGDGFAEPLLRLLGAEQICSVDASSYEGASIVHDMNLPIPSRLKAAFSVVIDAGTLEHIFDFPTAIRNCMEMVEERGHLLLVTPANNFLGHGFYQFSPELFFRVLSPENGFSIGKVIACEVDPTALWYQVLDPARAGRRVELTTSRPAYLLVEARKTHQVPVLTVAPQQSDYTALWREAAPSRPRAPAGPRPLHKRLVPGIVRRAKGIWKKVRPAPRRVRPDKEVFIEVSWVPRG